MAFPVEIGGWLYLQLCSLDIAIKRTASFQLQKIFYFDSAGDLAHDIGCLAIDIALDNAIRPDDHLGCAMNIAYQCAVNAKIPVAGDISFHRSARTDKASAGACRNFPQDIRFGFSIKHKYQILDSI